MIKIFAISDATGATAKRVLEAALTQFDSSSISVIRYGDVRDEQRIQEIVHEAANEGGFIVHTFVSEKLRNYIFDEGRNHNVATVDLMGPLLLRLSELLSIQPRSEPGLFLTLEPEYLRRVEAIEFTVRHDDGQRIEELDQAEIVLVGVSRTSKTPLSIYLANQGWKVANVPIMLDVEPPAHLFALPRKKVVALTIAPDRLVSLRKVRAERMGIRFQGYADLDHICREVAYAYQLFDRRKDWPLLDVTAKPIEEAASEVVAVLRRNPRDR
jgi:regulator of PEP synthase PpsR (kinase-PPPase family)